MNEGWLLPLCRAWHSVFHAKLITVTHLLKTASKAEGKREAALTEALKALPRSRNLSKLSVARMLNRIAPVTVPGFSLIKNYRAHEKHWRYAVVRTSEPNPRKPRAPKPAAPAMDDTERAIERLSRGEALRKTIESAPKPAAPVTPPPAVAPPPVDPAPCDVWTGPHGTAEEAESARAKISKHSGRPAVVVVIDGTHFARSVGCVDSLAVADAVRRINPDLRESARVGLYGTVPSRNALIQQSISNAREWQEIRAAANPPQVIGKRG